MVIQSLTISKKRKEMKKIFYILAAAIVALGTVACENEGLDNINPNINVDGDTVSFVAGINRTDLDGTATVWDEDDTIVVTWNGNKYEFKNAETGDKNTFKCKADGLSAIVDAENIKAVYSNNQGGKVDSAAGVAGALLEYEGAFGNIAFEVKNAFLKFTTSETVTLTASEGLFGEGTELVISEAGEHYVAINPVAATLEYKVGESMGKNLETTFEAKKIYNLGNLAKAIAGDSNGKNYTELATAFKLAESGATITLLEDITLGAEESGLTIANGKTFTLDLNGKTLSQVKECTKGHVLLNNNGTLTIEDNSSEKTGKIVMEDTGDGDPSFGWGTYAVRNNGTLTINGGTIETIIPDGISHCATALMLYAGKTTINDGNIICQNYRTIQGFFTPEVVINGGNFQGQVWMHETCSEGASLTINGGTFAPRGNDGSSVFLNNTKDIKLSITGGTFTTKVGCDDATKDGVVGAITGGKFTENALNEGKTKALIANGYVTYKDGENYVVATLQNAVNADAEEISVYDEIDLAKVSLDGYTGTIKGANENAVLNTRNYTGSSNEFYPIQNSEITFEDINIWFPTEDGDFLLTGIMSRSTLTFNNCDFEGQFTLNGQGTWTFNECNFVSTEDGAYASFVYGAANTVKFNTCKFSGVDRAAKVYGTGGTLNVLYDNCTFTSTTQNKAAVNVDATLATTTININNDCSQTGMGELYALVGTKGVIYIDGVQVAPISYVAKVGEDEYETFEAALTAAEAGSTIELLANVGDVTISQACTFTISNPNGYTFNPVAAEGFKITNSGTTWTVAEKQAYRVYVLDNCGWTKKIHAWTSGTNGDVNITGDWNSTSISKSATVNGFSFAYYEFDKNYDGKTVNYIISNNGDDYWRKEYNNIVLNSDKYYRINAVGEIIEINPNDLSTFKFTLYIYDQSNVNATHSLYYASTATGTAQAESGRVGYNWKNYDYFILDGSKIGTDFKVSVKDNNGKTITNLSISKSIKTDLCIGYYNNSGGKGYWANGTTPFTSLLNN